MIDPTRNYYYYTLYISVSKKNQHIICCHSKKIVRLMKTEHIFAKT